MEYTTISLSLTNETKEILDDFHYNLRKPKSVIIRSMLIFFKKHPKEFEKILLKKLEGNNNE